jgi:hypothetical protein
MKINVLVIYILLLSIQLIFISAGSVNAQKINRQAPIALATPGYQNDGPTVSISYKDTLTIKSVTEFDLPVVLKTGHDIAAISLGLNYPQEYLEVTGVVLADSVQGFIYSAKDGLFTLAWSRIEPIIIADNETLLTLKLKSADLSLLTGTIKLTVDIASEFADQSANVIEAVMLEVPEIKYLIPEPHDSVGGNYIEVYPNPFDDYTDINFFIKEESKVKITLFNLTGVSPYIITDADYPMGKYQRPLYGSDLAKGIYFLKFEIINPEKTNMKIIKIMSIR